MKIAQLLVKKLIKACKRKWVRSSEKRFTRWLRDQGCQIGEGVRWYGLKTINIDTTRPTLIEIGSNVSFTQELTILTHGHDWSVLRNIHHEILCSSGKVVIGNNVFVGARTMILKGTVIGDNCIIGAGSLVNKEIPPNSVAAGNPAKVICSIASYYEKRKDLYIDEAKVYARSIKENLGRTPCPSDFWEEFPLFHKAGMPLALQRSSVHAQLGDSYAHYLKTHHPHYENFEAFLLDAGVTQDCLDKETPP